MSEEVNFKHVALQYKDRKKAEIFFTKVLEIPLKKTFTVSKELAESIFGIEEEVIVDVYDNEKICFEVFVTKRQTKHSYEHTCVEIKDKDGFIRKCKEHGIEPNFVKKELKTLIFIRDFADNLYEIK